MPNTHRSNPFLYGKKMSRINFIGEVLKALLIKYNFSKALMVIQFRKLKMKQLFLYLTIHP